MTCIFVVLWNLFTPLQRELYIHLNSENVHVYMCSATCFLLDINVFWLWSPKCTGGQVCSEWVLLRRAGLETCAVQRGCWVWRLLLGPRVWTSVSVWEGRLGGGANSCALKRHLGTLENEGQFTSRVSGFLPLLGEKNSIYSIPVYLKVASLKVIA